MRLIDADALPALATELRLKNGKTKHFVGVELDDIRNAPTIDPVRHGKWIHDRMISTSGGTYGVIRCSECMSQYAMWETNYCANCGAKMERPCDKCQEWDCYGCDYKQTERSK